MFLQSTDHSLTMAAVLNLTADHINPSSAISYDPSHFPPLVETAVLPQRSFSSDPNPPPADYYHDQFLFQYGDGEAADFFNEVDHSLLKAAGSIQQEHHHHHFKNLYGMKKRKKYQSGGGNKKKIGFRTKSEKVEILDDGYKWRKYGKKSVKNNTNLRNYYKCSTEGCVVKKRVERDSKDPSFVVTIYEGIHSHFKPTGANFSCYNFNHIHTPTTHAAQAHSCNINTPPPSSSSSSISSEAPIPFDHFFNNIF